MPNRDYGRKNAGNGPQRNDLLIWCLITGLALFAIVKALYQTVGP